MPFTHMNGAVAIGFEAVRNRDLSGGQFAADLGSCADAKRVLGETGSRTKAGEERARVVAPQHAPRVAHTGEPLCTQKAAHKCCADTERVLGAREPDKGGGGARKVRSRHTPRVE